MSQEDDEFDFEAELLQELSASQGTQETILDLPFDVLLYILSTLCSLDLCHVIAVNRSLREIAKTPLLWRRLYALRWGRVSAQSLPETSDWRGLYAERDRSEIRHLTQSCGNDAFLLEIQRADLDARRLTEPPEPLFSDRSPHVNITVFGDGAEAEAIKTWRRRKNRPETAAREAQCSGHECRAATCHFDAISDQLYACNSSGILHRCGSSCDQRRLDPESEGTVLQCWISGRAWHVQEEEDAAGIGGPGPEDGEAGDEEGEEEDDDLQMSNLKSMFRLGYQSTENELRQFFGRGEYDRPRTVSMQLALGVRYHDEGGDGAGHA